MPVTKELLVILDLFLFFNGRNYGSKPLGSVGYAYCWQIIWRHTVSKSNFPWLISGLDMADMAHVLMQHQETDVGRKAYHLRNVVLQFQESFSVIEKCPQPVIATIHSACVGGGVDMICACDIRWCTSDAWFQVKVMLIALNTYCTASQKM